MNLQSVFLVLIQIAELSLQLSHHEHLLRVGLDSERIPRIVLEVRAYVLGETQRRQLASVVVFTVSRCDLTALQSVLVHFYEVGCFVGGIRGDGGDRRRSLD